MIKKIYHISDIHIRLFKRHGEYKEQIIKFLEEVKNHMESNDLTSDEVRIVIAGDILHSKNQLTPEAIHITTWLLNQCCKICRTIIILGNHDFLVNNLERMDALSPIIESMENPKLDFLKHTGCYLDDNIVWCVYGHMEGSKRPEIEDSKVNFGLDKTYVGLYHDPLIGLKTDAGYEFEDGQDVSIFEGLDMVLCGDIHKRQLMLYNGIEILQPGSLIQQDFGENVDGHGYAIWDVKTKKHEAFDLQSEYGFYKFKITSIDDIENESEILIN